ncbi:hypothetical protein C1637_05290 [Chryseobacterium lactis]|uniref:Uncharacterized protein n=1 Tax=Chryseobacterium lactis TaxID=1241981 RepID=A0A3G6RNQ9_CHRLC|nr:hypothetical protein [Chryseobacterium lactis]AZA84259.1 hypothetical protein EG342_21260 [Chryseobacterium lactis]AZB04647.1 hypothetical protein EG341_12140 [Chryseobacterium lactis]PNW14378.1 hypothetical protein C1637_05290 [Chryseobacterium lactis]
MKRKLSLLLLIFLSFSAFSQDYKQKIAKASCECTAEMKNKNLSPKEVNTQFGLCVIKSAMPYTKELKRDYNIDTTSLGADESPEADRFFQNLSLMMMTECSDTFSDFIKNGESPSKEQKDFVLKGTITKIEKENFVVFYLMDENKNLKKLNWVTGIESNLDLPKEYSSLLNKKVTANYYTADIFDVRINDYRNMNIISSLKTD